MTPPTDITALLFYLCRRYGFTLAQAKAMSVEDARRLWVAGK